MEIFLRIFVSFRFEFGEGEEMKGKIQREELQIVPLSNPN